MEKKTTAAKSTETVKRVRGIVKAINSRAHEAKANGAPVAYCMYSCQYEDILVAMDIVPVWTENYAGLCAAKQDANRFVLKAESQGYSNVVCGYVRVGLGFDAFRSEQGEPPPDSPDGGMELPDMLLGSSCACDPRYKWYQSLGRYLQAPVYNIDIVQPPKETDLDQSMPHFLKYQSEQLRGLVNFLEKQTGKKMDYDKLEAAFAETQATWQWWYEIDQLRKAVPCPMPSQDHFNAMVPALNLGGTPEATQFYKDLYDEVKQRMDSGLGSIEQEDYRLLWGGGLPPWHALWTFNYPEKSNGLFVIEDGYRYWDPVEIPADITDPIEKIAYRGIVRQSVRNNSAFNPTIRVERLLRYIDEYQIDGIVMHAIKSCRAVTIGMLHMKNLLQEHTSIPTLLLSSDMIDQRDYSEAQWLAQINAFMDAVKNHKASH